MTKRSEGRPPRRTRRRDAQGVDLSLERAETLAARAEEVFETTVETLRDAVRTLKTDPGAGERDVVKDVRAMNAALMLAMEMQEKARVAGSTHFGGGCSARLDLAAAREEISARLAHLRDVADRNGVP